MGERERIRDQLHRSFAGNAWHGPSLREVLQGVTAEGAARRVAPEVHSIWEIVIHCGVWKRVARKRLEGNRIDHVSDEQDWPPVSAADEPAWQVSLARLHQEQERLDRTLDQIDETQLDQLVPGQNYTFYGMLHGVIQHDLYHAGQIAVLKKIRLPA